MSEILEQQQLEVDNLLSYRGKILQSELNQMFLDMKSYIEKHGAKCIGNPITATFGVSNERGQVVLDSEILIPISEEIVGNNQYMFKGKLKIENAVVAEHKGPSAMFQETCNKLNQYIINKKYTPITVGYNVTKGNATTNVESVEMSIYVGISNNIL